MNPQVVSALLTAIPGLSTLFGGGPKVPSYSAGDYASIVNQLYRQLLNSPMGQNQLNEATVAGNLAKNSLIGNVAGTGLAGSGLGNVLIAGGQGFGAMERMKVLAALSQLASEQGNNLLNGQFRSGAYNWENPSGFKAFAGGLGQSAWPYILKAFQQQSQNNGPKYPVPSWGGTGSFDPNAPYAGMGG